MKTRCTVLVALWVTAGAMVCESADLGSELDFATEATRFERRVAQVAFEQAVETYEELGFELDALPIPEVRFGPPSNRTIPDRIRLFPDSARYRRAPLDPARISRPPAAQRTPIARPPSTKTRSTAVPVRSSARMSTLFERSSSTSVGIPFPRPSEKSVVERYGSSPNLDSGTVRGM